VQWLTALRDKTVVQFNNSMRYVAHLRGQYPNHPFHLKQSFPGTSNISLWKSPTHLRGCWVASSGCDPLFVFSSRDAKKKGKKNATVSALTECMFVYLTFLSLAVAFCYPANKKHMVVCLSQSSITPTLI
jgi:hypothetical protein